MQVGAQRASEGLRGRLYEALVAVLGYLYNGRVAPPPRDFLVEVLFASYTFEIPELVNLFQVRLWRRFDSFLAHCAVSQLSS